MEKRSDAVGGRAMNRRDFLRLGGFGTAGALALGSSGCGIFAGGDSQEDEPLVFSTSGGAGTEATQKGWISPFTEETGIAAETQVPTDYSRLRAMVEADQVTWNVLFMTNVQIGNEEQSSQFLEAVDYSIVDAEGIPEDLQREYGIGALQYSQVLAFNTEELGEEPPQSWADFFDVERFPGKRAIGTTVELYFPLEIALMADGVPMDELYPLDIDRALEKLDTIRDDLVFYESASEGQQLLGDGEVAMSVIYHTRAALLEQEDLPVRTQWNQNISVVDFLGVPKGASRVDDSFRLIAFAVSAENNARYTEFNPNAPVNTESAERVPEDLARYLPIYDDRLDLALYPDLDWWGENLEEAAQRYEQWLLG